MFVLLERVWLVRLVTIHYTLPEDMFWGES
jgi:hypothetical protein